MHHTSPSEEAVLTSLPYTMPAACRTARSGVSLQGLTPCGKAALESIKAAEESKEKTYRALCWSEAPLQQERELAGLVALGRVTCQQDTPVRVLHRRAPKVGEGQMRYWRQAGAGREYRSREITSHSARCSMELTSKRLEGSNLAAVCRSRSHARHAPCRCCPSPPAAAAQVGGDRVGQAGAGPAALLRAGDAHPGPWGSPAALRHQ